MIHNRIPRLLIIVSSLVVPMLLVTAVAAFSFDSPSVSSSQFEPLSTEMADDPLPVLSIRPDPVEVSGNAGGTAEATITVSEQGGLAGAQGIELQATDLSDGVGHVISGTTMTFDPALFNLLAGEEQRSNLSIPVPAELPAGIYDGEIVLHSLDAGSLTATLTVDTRPATIIIDLQLEGADTTTFDFYGSLGDFSLSAGESEEFLVNAGSYAIAEAPQYWWELASIDCDSYNVNTILNTLDLYVASGETIRCTFVNQSFPLRQNVQFISRLGGQTFSAAAQGNYAFLGEGPQLTVLDIKDPSNPIKVGETGTLPEVVRDVLVEGEYAYVADMAGLHIFDVSDPSQPMEIGTLRLPGYMAELALYDDYLVVAAGDGGVRIVDVTDPTAPKEISRFLVSDGDWSSVDVAVADDVAYVIESSGMGCNVQFFDISSPAEPEYVGGYVDVAADCFDDVAASGAYVYLGVEDYAGDSSFVILDVSDPANPIVVQSLDTGGGVSSLLLVDEIAYVTNIQDQLLIINVSDPTDLKLLGQCDFMSRVHVEAVDDDLVLLIDLTGGLHIVDVSDPAEPFEWSFTDLPLASAEQIAAASEDTLLLWNGSYSNFLHTMDISQPTAPTLTGWSAPETWFEDMVVAGDYAYLLADGFRVYSLENPIVPVEIGSLDTPGVANDIAAAGKFAFITGEGLRIIDVSDPSDPKEASQLDWPGNSTAVSAEGNFAYVVGTTWVPGISLGSWFKVIDVSAAESPYEAGSVDIPEPPRDVVVSGGFAYVLGDPQGLYVINITDPKAPVQVGYYQLPDRPGAAYELSVSGRTVFVADRYFGIRIIDAGDPAAPVEAGYYNTPGLALDVTLAGDYVAVADYTGGLLILRYVPKAEQNGITIAKETDPAEVVDTFEFTGELGGFSLSGGENMMFSELTPGAYTVTEADVTGWALEQIVCDSVHVTKNEQGITIELGEGEHITCTFHNKRLTVTADAGGPYEGDEGAHITVDARATTNKDMVATYKWDCHDDGFFEKSSSKPLDKSCKYADNGEYTVRLQTVDIFGQTSEDTAEVTVSNVPPQVTVGPDQEATMGQVLTFSGSFTDPGTADTHTISWDFGDGGTVSDTLKAEHAFSALGAYTVTLTVTDDDGGTGSAALIVDVVNSPPTMSNVKVSPAVIDEGQSFYLSGALHDPEGDALTLFVDWGDGKSVTREFAAGAQSFSIMHPCADDPPGVATGETYTISLKLSDELGAFSEATIAVEVDNVAPAINVGADQTVKVGETAVFSAAVTDPGMMDTWTVTWDFGDGSPTAEGAMVSHVFAEPGTFWVTATVEDDDGGVSVDTLTVVARELFTFYMPVFAW